MVEQTLTVRVSDLKRAFQAYLHFTYQNRKLDAQEEKAHWDTFWNRMREADGHVTRTIRLSEMREAG